MGQLQAKTGEIPTLDDALKELLENYKRKSRRQLTVRIKCQLDFDYTSLFSN